MKTDAPFSLRFVSDITGCLERLNACSSRPVEGSFDVPYPLSPYLRLDDSLRWRLQPGVSPSAALQAIEHDWTYLTPMQTIEFAVLNALRNLMDKEHFESALAGPECSSFSFLSLGRKVIYLTDSGPFQPGDIFRMSLRKFGFPHHGIVGSDRRVYGSSLTPIALDKLQPPPTLQRIRTLHLRQLHQTTTATVARSLFAKLLRGVRV